MRKNASHNIRHWITAVVMECNSDRFFFTPLYSLSLFSDKRRMTEMRFLDFSPPNLEDFLGKDWLGVLPSRNWFRRFITKEGTKSC